MWVHSYGMQVFTFCLFCAILRSYLLKIIQHSLFLSKFVLDTPNIFTTIYSMKKSVLIIIASALCLTIQAKTTYIPIYRSFIQIKQGLSDSIMAQSKLGWLDLTAQDGSFSITLVHEDLDKKKIKAIKRSKAAEGWATVAALISGFSAGYDAAYYNNALITYLEMRRTENLAFLSGFLHDVANAEERLDINFFIDNHGDEELMVADLARGLTWYILPHTSLQFSMANPGIERLRISNLKHTSVKYADIIGGNSVQKVTLEWEDENCWIVRWFVDNADQVYDVPDYSNSYQYYQYIDKATYESRDMTISEVKEFKKNHKEK